MHVVALCLLCRNLLAPPRLLTPQLANVQKDTLTAHWFNSPPCCPPALQIRWMQNPVPKDQFAQWWGAGCMVPGVKADLTGEC